MKKSRQNENHTFDVLLFFVYIQIPLRRNVPATRANYNKKFKTKKLNEKKLFFLRVFARDEDSWRLLDERYSMTIF